MLPVSVLAQQSTEVVTTYAISDNQAKPGDLIASDNDKLVRATIPYDERLFGVYTEQAVIEFKATDDPNKLIARYGVTNVTVSTINGTINEGDLITTSDIPGVGQKATRSGYVLGRALEKFDGTGITDTQVDSLEHPEAKTTKIGTIRVALRIEYAELTNTRSLGRLFDSLNAYLNQSIKNPQKSIEVLRLLLAALVVLLTFAIAFFLFARSIPNFIEAIGRNPLAKNAIYFSIGMSIALTLITILIGVGAAFFLIRL